ncbi:MAG: tRNA (adenosine(37)-N6)-threonylcarbamoyltransferase complex transferase subunit TsaD [Pseudomonadota bacterium]
MKEIIILGIETSCDETGVAIYSSTRGLLAEQLFSQIALHAKYGGVVPEIAARDHSRRLISLVDKTIKQSGCTQQDITAVAYTAGPGLAGALFVGACFAQALAMGWQRPAIAVHHMEGHLLSPLMEGSIDASSHVACPFLALLVSGGHTQLILVKTIGHYELIGDTLDDAAGEAFDKVAKLLDLPYPGGPAVAQLADQATRDNHYNFPRPLLNREGYDFSFSGLKTAVRQQVEQLKNTNVFDETQRAAIAASFQAAVVETLIKKTLKAAMDHQVQSIVVSGGVGANRRLRQDLSAHALSKGIIVHFPPLHHCTDNGAMIAFAGYHRYRLGDFEADNRAVEVFPRWALPSNTSPHNTFSYHTEADAT